MYSCLCFKEIEYRSDTKLLLWYLFIDTDKTFRNNVDDTG